MNKGPIIVLIGKARSGKDTFAKIAKELYPSTVRVAFADDIKDMYCKIKGITLEELEANKALYRKDLILCGMLGREMNPDTWVIRTLKKTTAYADYMHVITDCRFNNELAKIRTYFKGNPIYVVRVMTSDKTLIARGLDPETLEDASENGIDLVGIKTDPKYGEMYNDGTEEEFRTKVSIFLKGIMVKHGLQKESN